MFIGIDLGGTNIAAALVDSEGRIIKRAGIPTRAAEGPDAIKSGLMQVCEALLFKAGQTRLADAGTAPGDGAKPEPGAIGIGIPGTINAQTGDIIFTANLPLKGVNIARELEQKYGCPVRLGNDANCAALGEVVSGGAKGARNVVFITLGTGVGGGIILDGRLYTGLTGAAGEIGHDVIVEGGRPCGCGRDGCWETYASATGLVKTASEIMVRHMDSLLWQLCGGMIENVDGSMVFSAYRSGDKVALLTVENYLEHLAVGVVNLINILEPEMICIGGGISNAWDCIAGPLGALVDAKKYTRYSVGLPQTRIVKAELGNDAGIIGAAMLGREIN